MLQDCNKCKDGYMQVYDVEDGKESVTTLFVRCPFCVQWRNNDNTPT